MRDGDPGAGAPESRRLNAMRLGGSPPPIPPRPSEPSRMDHHQQVPLRGPFDQNLSFDRFIQMSGRRSEAARPPPGITLDSPASASLSRMEEGLQGTAKNDKPGSYVPAPGPYEPVPSHIALPQNSSVLPHETMSAQYGLVHPLSAGETTGSKYHATSLESNDGASTPRPSAVPSLPQPHIYAPAPQLYPSLPRLDSDIQVSLGTYQAPHSVCPTEVDDAAARIGSTSPSWTSPISGRSLPGIPEAGQNPPPDSGPPIVRSEDVDVRSRYAVPSSNFRLSNPVSKIRGSGASINF